MPRHILVILLFIILSAGLVAAQSTSNPPVAYVYRIKSAGCTFSPQARRQTGFRVQGVKGLVTALHGVADCQTISAVADDGQEIFNDLTLQAVDIERDTALLSSPELENLPDEGLAPSQLSYAEIPREGLRVVGYPLGLDKQDVDSNLLIRDIEPLDDVIPDMEEPADFIKRRSPDFEIMVLNVQAQLLPGHSGAPLLDSSGQVAGIANGGLRGGTVGRSWAIPWRDINLQRIEQLEVAGRLHELVNNDPAIALAFSSTYPQQASDIDYKIRVVNPNSTPVSNAEVTFTYRQGYEIGFTDSEGFYTFRLPSDANYTQNLILIEAPGYTTYRRYVDNLTEKTQPAQIQLLPNSSHVSRYLLLERGSYIRITWSSGLGMYSAPRAIAPKITDLAAGAILKVTDGPIQDGELQWWKVQSIFTDHQAGWIVPADADTEYVERLPRIFNDDTVEVIEERLSLYKSVGINAEIVGPVEQGEKSKVIDGPQEADGYLWYKLERSDGVQGWAKAFGETDYIKIVTPISASIATPTVLRTATLTSTATSTLTPTVPPTATATPTPTVTATWTPTATQTSTPTLTNTPTPSATNVPPPSTQVPGEAPTQHLEPNVSTPTVTNNTGDNVNLRSGPGLSYSVSGKLKPGDSLEVTGRHSLFGVSDDENWWQVKLPNGSEAWVRRDVVDESGDFDEVPVVAGYPTPTPTNIPQSAAPTESIATSTLTDTPTPASIKPTTNTPTPASIGSQETKPATNTPTPASIEPTTDTPTPASIGLEKIIPIIYIAMI